MWAKTRIEVKYPDDNLWVSEDANLVYETNW